MVVLKVLKMADQMADQSEHRKAPKMVGLMVDQKECKKADQKECKKADQRVDQKECKKADQKADQLEN